MAAQLARFIRAARRGQVDAMVFLARLLAFSRHRAREYIEAYVWLTLAIERGDEMAKSDLTAVIPAMRQEEIDAAEERLTKLRGRSKGKKKEKLASAKAKPLPGTTAPKGAKGTKVPTGAKDTKMPSGAKPKAKADAQPGGSKTKPSKN